MLLLCSKKEAKQWHADRKRFDPTVFHYFPICVRNCFQSAIVISFIQPAADFLTAAL